MNHLILPAILVVVGVLVAFYFLLEKLKAQSAQINKLSAGQSDISNLFNKHIISTQSRLEKKADRLSDDDKFLEDAKLSNTITQVAKAAANKRIEDAVSELKATLKDAREGKLKPAVYTEDKLGHSTLSIPGHHLGVQPPVSKAAKRKVKKSKK